MSVHRDSPGKDKAVKAKRNSNADWTALELLTALEGLRRTAARMKLARMEEDMREYLDGEIIKRRPKSAPPIPEQKTPRPKPRGKSMEETPKEGGDIRPSGPDGRRDDTKNQIRRE